MNVPVVETMFAEVGIWFDGRLGGSGALNADGGARVEVDAFFCSSTGAVDLPFSGEMEDSRVNGGGSWPFVWLISGVSPSTRDCGKGSEENAPNSLPVGSLT